MGQENIVNMDNLEGVILTPLKIVNMVQGDIFHGMKSLDKGFNGFGEAYFSSINPGMIKAWKRHNIMTLNLIVPIGKVSFVIFDDRESSATNGKFQEIELSKEKQKKIRLFTTPAPAREVSLIHSKSQLKMPIISALRATISSIIRGAIKFDNIKVIPPKKINR